MYSVLYVDDEPALLDVAKLFLERTSELQVSVCTSAEEALASPSIASYDAIISDYQMPAMDGITFLKAVRERFGDVPFILFTGRGREEVVIEAINNGADFYIQKGGDPKAQFAELLHKIRQAVRRKQAERSLQDSERRLADIIDFLPDATFAIDRSGSVIAWNRAIEDMTGVPSGDMRGQDGFAYAVPFYGVRRPILIDLISEPDEKIAAFYPNVSRSGTTLSTEIDLASPSGQRVFLLAMACPLYNQAGEVTGAIESIRDVTNYKTIQRDLKRSEERYRSIVNDQTEMIVRFTPDGTITFTNEAFRSFFAPDLPGDALEGEQIRAIMPAASLPDDDAIVASLTPARPVYELEIQTAGPDGVPLWHFWSVRALFDEEKNPAEYQVVGRDITGQKQAEEELLLLKNSIDQAYDEVFKLDFDGNILYVNDAASRTTGYSHDELCSMTIFDLDADVTPAIWDRCVADLRERKTQYLDARHRRRDGTIVDVEISASYIRKGDREYSFTFVRDITARKQVEDALRESEGRFRGMAERSSDMILVIDKSLTPSYVSPAVRPILGYEPEELVGQTAEFAATEIFSGCSREFGNLIRANMQGTSRSSMTGSFPGFRSPCGTTPPASWRRWRSPRARRNSARLSKMPTISSMK
ncbi:MAG: PAS domain S-box protein [Methanomicrobiales archaeon]|nr:PAS domain S-box protein [Methanomicrobiales archaeon]